MSIMEIRSGGSLSASPGKLKGYAAVYNSFSRDLGGFFETIRPGAFKRSLSNSDHILALLEHDSRNILGRCGAGTLSLFDDDHGLGFELSLPDTTYARDLSVSVERGDISGCSFGFRVRDDRWEMRGDRLIRDLMEVDLFEITITSNPAYLDTTVAKRAMDAIRRGWEGPCLQSLWLETV